VSRENVELVHRAAGAFNRHDVAALEELSHHDLEFVSVVAAVDAGGAAFHGPDTWRTYFAVMDEMWDEWQVEEVEVFDAGGDRVASRFHMVGKGKQSGVPVDQVIGIAYWFRDGKLHRLQSYLDPDDALEAVGLRE
jgi:ketosteroid isomerase-like protein